MCVAVDIGGTAVKSAVVSAEGRIMHPLRRATPRTERAFVDGLEQQLRAQVSECRRVGAVPLGVGVACLGAVDPLRGEVIGACDTLPILLGLPLKNIAEACTGLPVVLENDVNAAALGEHVSRGLPREVSLLYIALGTGIGGGFVYHGEILRGEQCIALEVAHQSIDHAGRRCPCGRRGCWEAYLSQQAILADYNTRSRSREKVAEVESVFKCARAGEAAALQSIERVKKLLVVGLANLVNILDPTLVVVGGGIGLGLRRYLKGIQQELTAATCGAHVRVVAPLKPRYSAFLAGASLVFAESMKSDTTSQSSPGEAAPMP